MIHNILFTSIFAYENLPFNQVTMASSNSTNVPDAKLIDEPVDVKGKGKAVATEEPIDHSMDEDEDEDSGDEEVSER